MSEHRDYKAEYGYTPTWDRQREKQEQFGDARKLRHGSPAACPDCGESLTADADRVICLHCGYECKYESTDN